MRHMLLGEEGSRRQVSHRVDQLWPATKQRDDDVRTRRAHLVAQLALVAVEAETAERHLEGSPHTVSATTYLAVAALVDPEVVVRGLL